MRPVGGLKVVLAAVGVVTGGLVGAAKAAPIYEVNFSSAAGTAHGSSIGGVTGGNATILAAGTGTGVVNTSSPLGTGGAGYLTAVGTGTNNNGGATLSPSAGNGWNALSPLVGGQRVLQGGFDFFYRNEDRTITATTGGNSIRAVDYFNVSNNNLRPIVAGGTNSAALEITVGAGFPALKTASNFQLTKGQTYHIAVAFSNNGTTSTANLYVVQGDGEIDTTLTAPVATVSSDLQLSGGAEPGSFGSGAFSFGALNARNGDRFSFDAFRLYSETPTAFAQVPEPTVAGIGALSSTALLLRRRRRSGN